MSSEPTPIPFPARQVSVCAWCRKLLGRSGGRGAAVVPNYGMCGRCLERALVALDPTRRCATAARKVEPVAKAKSSSRN